MKNEFIPYGEAIALKELGFDEQCLFVYLSKDNIKLNCGFSNYPKDLYPNAINTPLYQQVFRWFREKHNFDSHISPAGYYGYMFIIISVIEKHNNEGWTYEEAELACLRKLIKIVKNEPSVN
jgi:hypothetical protein